MLNYYIFERLGMLTNTTIILNGHFHDLLSLPVPPWNFFRYCCSSIFPRLNAPDLEFSRLESWSRDPFLQVLVSVLVSNLGVLVLVLEPQSLGLVTLEYRSRSWS